MPEEELPRSVIVGAIEIEECATIEGNAKAFLADRFGPRIAEFYPGHFIPEGEEKHVWLLEKTLAAETPGDWDETVPRTWARCNTWIEGDPILLTGVYDRRQL